MSCHYVSSKCLQRLTLYTILDDTTSNSSDSRRVRYGLMHHYQSYSQDQAEEESMPLLVTITTIVNIGTLLLKAYLPSIHSTRAAMKTETKLAKQCINGRILKSIFSYDILLWASHLCLFLDRRGKSIRPASTRTMMNKSEVGRQESEDETSVDESIHTIISIPCSFQAKLFPSTSTLPSASHLNWRMY